MLIANPLYDSVFKFLMENVDIAKGVISAIIGEPVVHLELQAQESQVKVETLTYYRLDFKAKILQKDNQYKNVLIELQKSTRSNDLLRFRRYLGDQYKKEESCMSKDNTSETSPIPIIVIYILGYRLSKTLPAVIKVNRTYMDLLEGEPIFERNEFIECLTHDSYVIQVPALQLQMRTQLDYILSVFKQEHFWVNDHRLKDYVYESDDALMKKILKQLEIAAADEKLMNQLEAEELAYRDYDRQFGKIERELAEKNIIISENEKILLEQNLIIEAQEQRIKELIKKYES